MKRWASAKKMVKKPPWDIARKILYRKNKLLLYCQNRLAKIMLTSMPLFAYLYTTLMLAAF